MRLWRELTLNEQRLLLEVITARIMSLPSNLLRQQRDSFCRQLRFDLAKMEMPEAQLEAIRLLLREHFSKEAWVA
jgi:hypothetical protein